MEDMGFEREKVPPQPPPSLPARAVPAHTRVQGLTCVCVRASVPVKAYMALVAYDGNVDAAVAHLIRIAR